MAVRVKICGITRPEDARTAARLGADYLGLILAPSPRRVDPGGLAWLRELRAEFPAVQWVGVFVKPDPIEMVETADRLALDLLQIHGVEAPTAKVDRPWIMAVPARSTGSGHALPWELPPPSFEEAGSLRGRVPFGVLLDTPDDRLAGGTGRVFDWATIPEWSRRVRLFLAGGLAPENVATAVEQVRPFAVDASSRLERSPGIKDEARLRSFFAALARVREE